MPYPPRPGWWMPPPGEVGQYDSPAAFADAASAARAHELETATMPTPIEAIEITRNTVGRDGPVEAGDILYVPADIGAEDASTLLRLDRAVVIGLDEAKAKRGDSGPPKRPDRTGSRAPNRTR